MGFYDYSVRGIDFNQDRVVDSLDDILMDEMEDEELAELEDLENDDGWEDKAALIL